MSNRIIIPLQLDPDGKIQRITFHPL